MEKTDGELTNTAAGQTSRGSNDLNGALLRVLSPSNYTLGDMESPEETSSLTQAQELIEEGADIHALVNDATRLFTRGYMIPLILLLEHGAAINTPNDAGDLPIEEVLYNLPVSDEVQVNTNYSYDYFKSDWRKLISAFDKDKPSWLHVWTRYPRGPFMSINGWEEQSNEGVKRIHIDMLRTEIMDWFLDHGALINAVRSDNKTILMRIIHRYLSLDPRTDQTMMLSLWEAINYLLVNGATLENDPSDELQTQIRRIYNGLPICQDIIFNRQNEAIEKLKSLFKTGLQNEYIECYFSLAIGQSRNDVVQVILDNALNKLSKSTRIRALISLASIGNFDMFRNIITSMQKTGDSSSFSSSVNRVFLRAVAQGSSDIVRYILDDPQYARLLGKEMLGECFLRAARQGHGEVFTMLYDYFAQSFAALFKEWETITAKHTELSRLALSQRDQDEQLGRNCAALELELNNMSNGLRTMRGLLEKAFMVAVVSRRYLIVQFLLARDLYSSIRCNYNVAAKRLKNILNNPHLPSHHREEYMRIATLIRNYSAGQMALGHRPMQNEAPITLLPPELLAHIMYFLVTYSVSKHTS